MSNRSLPAFAWVLFVAAGCTLNALDFDGKRCPCVAGWTCDEVTGICGKDGVVISSLRVAWTTPNSIRWEWDVNDPPPDRFSAYELVVGPTEDDVRSRSPKTTVWDAVKNPELGHFLLQRTGGLDKVVGTITDGHRSQTIHYGQLTAIDNKGLRSSSSIVRALTTYAGAETPILTDGECAPGCFYLPSFFKRSQNRPFAGPDSYEATICCDSEPDPQKRVCDKVPSCYENLRVSNLQKVIGQGGTGFSEGAFATTAFVELAIANGSRIPSSWSEIWIWIGDGTCDDCIWRYSPLSFRADDAYRVIQIPLRVLRNATTRKTLTYQELKDQGHKVFSVNVGGGWTPGAKVRVDEVRIHW